MTSSPPHPRPNTTGKLILLAGLLLLLLGNRSEALATPHELRLGIEPEHNIFTQMENYRKFAGYLASKTGIPIHLTVMSRYGEVLQRFKNLHLDGALLDSYTATLAIDTMGMEPIVRPINRAGDLLSRGLIFTRKDSGIREVGDMRGKSFAFVDPATSEGYLFPLAYLRNNGVRDPNSYIGHQFFTGSHASAISAVLDGRADLGAAKDAAYTKQIAKDPATAKELVIIARSEPLPPTTLFLKTDLPQQLKLELANALLAMPESREGREILQIIGAQRFTRAEKQEYGIVREMAKEAGLKRERVATE